MELMKWKKSKNKTSKMRTKEISKMEKLGTKYTDYSKHFTHNSVIAWWDEPKYSVTTNATAMKYGWRWNINLQHRSGNGYIYDNNYITADQALEQSAVPVSQILLCCEVQESNI